MRTTIETASQSEIAQYLKHLEDIALDEARKDNVESEMRHSSVWKTLYETIFSKEISQKIMERFPDFSWNDPDEDYFDDVCAFIHSFCEYSENHTNDEDCSQLFPSYSDWREKQGK